MIPVNTQVITKTKQADIEIMPMDEAISIMLHGDVTPERVQGLMDCIKFEEDKPDFVSQIGMTPDEFHTKYADLLESEDPYPIVTVAKQLAEAYNRTTAHVLETIESYTENMTQPDSISRRMNRPKQTEDTYSGVDFIIQLIDWVKAYSIQHDMPDHMFLHEIKFGPYTLRQWENMVIRR